jgi:hypothetical protein
LRLQLDLNSSQPTKRKRPWGAGVFLVVDLGVVGGLLHIHVATLGGW